MGKHPEAPMERWGVMSILREALRLLDRNHFRLFLPFFLAFHVPASILGAVQQVILKVASPQPAITSLDFSRAYNSSRQEDVHVDTDSQPFSLTVLMSVYALGLVIYILAVLSWSAYAYIVKYIYFEAGTESDNDRPIIKKVFGLLPRALLRVFVTHLWIYLVLVLLAAACLILAFVLNVIWTANTGGESGPTLALWLLFAGVPYLIGALAVGIMFMLAWCVAVLEPENYGRAALKVSAKYVRGSFTKSIAILLVPTLLSLFSYYIQSLQVVPIREDIDWLIIANLIFRASIFSVVVGGAVGLYVDVAFVVAYFVFKSKFESVLPETIPRGSMIPASKNPYQRLVHDSTQPITVDEP